jgi:hypothetical protein
MPNPQSSIWEPTTSAGVVTKSFVPISRTTISGDTFESTPRNKMWGTVRPPTPCRYMSAS